MSTTYISIDVATRSLAIGVYRMRSFKDMLKDLPTDPIELNDYYDSIIQPLTMQVFDISNGVKAKDMSITDKAIELKRVLIAFDETLTLGEDEKIIVLIEYQMNANHMSNAIFNMLLFHYAGRYPVEVVKPSMKNTIALHPLLTIGEFLGRATTNYKANKEHTKWNMIYLLTVIDCMDMIKGIKKANQDDIADTLCQALAWHKRSCC